MSTKLNFLQDIKTLFMKPLLEKFRRNSRQEKKRKEKKGGVSIKGSQLQLCLSVVGPCPSNSKDLKHYLLTTVEVNK